MAPAKKPSKKKAPAKPAKQPGPKSKKAAGKPKASAKKATPKQAAPKAPRPEPARAPEPPAEEPEFVREASAAERKAALEALLEKEGVDAIFPTVQNPNVPKPLPSYVRERSAQERKAAVEQLVEDSGVATALAKAPWKRGGPAETTPKPPSGPVPAAEPQRTSPRVQMTTAPTGQTQTREAPRVVILDTNALMMQFQFHVDIEREVRRILDFNFEIVVPTVVVTELERIVKQGNQKEATEARMAVELAKTYRVEKSDTDGDTALLRMAEKLNAIVVTNDKVLRARLRAKGIPNIYMRSRAFLTLEGHIPGL